MKAPLSTDHVASHTPGPWWVERRVGDALQVNGKHRGEGSSYGIASVNHWEGAADRANANLIAAAPDLLTLAKQYASECSSCSGTRAAPMCCEHREDQGGTMVCCGGPEIVPCQDCADIWAAIDKAEGRS